MSQDLKGPPGMSLVITALAYCPVEPRLLAIGVGGTVVSATSSRDEQPGRSAATDIAVNKVLIWDLMDTSEGRPAADRPRGPGHGTGFWPPGASLASSGADGSVLVWDLKAELDAARSDGKAAAADANGRILPVDLATGRPLARRLVGHRGRVQDVAFASDGHNLVSAGLDGLLILWDLDRTQRLALTVPGFEDADWAPVSLSVSPTGREFAVGSGGLGSRLRFHDLGTNKTVERDQVKLTGFGIADLGYSPDGQAFYATVGDLTNTTRFWKTSDWSELPFSLRQNDEVTKLAFSPDGAWLAGLHNYNFRPRRSRARASGPGTPSAKELAAKVDIPNPKSGPWKTMAFSPDGGTLALGDSAGTVAPFRPGDAKPFRESRRHLAAVRSLAFGTNGRFLASGGDDNAVVFWDQLNPDAPPEPQSVHRGPVVCLAFEPYGLMLASGGDDGAIVFWDVRTGLPLGPAFVAHGGIASLAFLPDGKRLFSGGRHGIVLSWDVDPESWVKKACSVANRNLTMREWEENFEREKYHRTCPDLPVLTTSGW